MTLKNLRGKRGLREIKNKNNMDNDIQKLIKQRLDELPSDIKEAIRNTDLAGKFEAIADKHSLHVDQNGALQTETLLVMIGLEPTENYVGNIQRELEVSRTEAQSLAEDVNKEILGNIRASIQHIEEEQANLDATTEINPNSTLSPLEKVGNLTIEKRPPSHSPQYNDSVLNRQAVLNDLENIKNLRPENATAFVDHLLANPVSNPPQIEEKREAQANKQTNPQQSPRKYDNDPYREQV